MRNIMIFQHVAHEILGTLNPLLKSAGFRIRYVNFERHPDLHPTLEGYNGLIVLGGPMGVYEEKKYPHLAYEMKMIEWAIRNDIPVLGICLGAQMIAKVLGAKVEVSKHKEIGWHHVELTPEGQSDHLFSSWRPTEKVFQMHGDFFELPKGASHLAASELCEGQAFRFGQKIYGLQFHLEVDQAMIQRWMNLASHRAEFESFRGHFDLESVAKDTEKYISRSLELSQNCFSRFISLFGEIIRHEHLGSGHEKKNK